MKKNILIIGGSHGIGWHLTNLLLPEYNVFTASRTPGQLENTSSRHQVFDVIQDDAEDLELPESLDGFVYCPGSINLKPFRGISEKMIREEMEVNFFGLLRVLKKVVPIMNQHAAMVFFSTVAVKTGMPYHAGIASAKGAVEGLSRSLAAELAPKIRVNVVAPSLTDTPLAERLLNNETKREKMAERHPLKSVGDPEEIAEAVKFLLSEKSSWITGQVIHIDGGLSSLNIN